jgi:3-hydroxy-9,10-secoandrosta-1,3,5(10)-triene-9,17-dione monooxygenase
MTVTASTQPAADDTTAASPDLITRAAGVVPLLSQNAKATEENRRVVQENIEAIKKACPDTT